MTDTAVMDAAISERALNVVLSPESEAHRRVRRQHPPRQPQAAGPASPHLAPGFQPQPSWNLTNFGGPTISDLTFVNRYVGGAAAWSTSDMTNIDNALSAALSDSGLESVMAQYFPGATISSTMLPSAVHDGAAPGTVFKDTAEALAQQLHSQGALGSADPAKSVICMMLPQGWCCLTTSRRGSSPRPARRRPRASSAASGA